MLLERAVEENCWEITPGVYRILIPLSWDVPFVNAYVVRCKEEWVLIDTGPGSPAGLRALGRALKAIGVSERGLAAILLTHRHPDHGGGAAAVLERWGGRIYVHPAEMWQRVREPERLLRWLTRAGFPSEAISAITERIGDRERSNDNFPSTVSFYPEDRPLKVGDLAVRALHTPGHSPGHVMLWVADRGWLFAGDHILPRPGSNVWANPSGSSNPLAEYLRSLQDTACLPSTWVFPGHGLPWRGSPSLQALAIQQWHERRAQDLYERMKPGTPYTAFALAAAERPDLESRPHAMRSVVAEVLACLLYLEAEGLVTRQGDEPVLWERAE